MRLFLRRPRRKGQRAPVVATPEKPRPPARPDASTTSVHDMDVSREDRGYDPYDTSPRDNVARNKNKKFSF